MTSDEVNQLMHNPMNVSRTLSAYLARQRRNGTPERAARAGSTTGQVSRARAATSPQPATGPDYGCVEWYMYEPPRA